MGATIELVVLTGGKMSHNRCSCVSFSTKWIVMILFSSLSLSASVGALVSPTTTTTATTTTKTVPTSKEYKSISLVPKTNWKDPEKLKTILSNGSSIQLATSVEEILAIAETMWLPTDENLPKHLQRQVVHHEKRQRWASQLINQLSRIVIPTDNFNHLTDNILPLEQDVRLGRIIEAIAQPCSIQIDRPDKEGRYIREALHGLHAVLARRRQQQLLLPRNSPIVQIDESVGYAICTLLERANPLALNPSMSLKDICEIRWSAQGIRTRLIQQMEETFIMDSSTASRCTKLYERVNGISFHSLHERVVNLPFDVIPCGIDWNYIIALQPTTTTQQQQDQQQESMQQPGEHHSIDPIIPFLRTSIPFQFDTIATRKGTAVVERRGTAWVVERESNIGALAYSGKLMTPRSMPDIVNDIMRACETTLMQHPQDLRGKKPLSNLWMDYNFFDCALCNYYPNGNSACKFHTDPEHGSHWDRTTIVVPAGQDRKFAFRPIPQHTTWQEWDPISTTYAKNNDEDHMSAITHLFSGDLVVMTAQCNDQFFHAVHAAEAGQEVNLVAATMPLSSGSERISLVLKRALDLGGGTRGHGLEGQGRRSKKKKQTPKLSSTVKTMRKQQTRERKQRSTRPPKRRKRQ